ncbi:hypothetical protein NAEGRDRAFT_79544 [Naegleria gruberi]|uniref:C2H2-type domain-containing protein n=1 Tax=Naegleria gruberi TaxID=5762 RepID=D2VDL4_NAEGR|nr:uncharacterized protein NAEGRDRAFT_79544 [Naegleria gruberi]EFC45020.1 hypothetical protein NAEGRDRAFT_79544 [Naegleria gruberi]|eukprot:XP_002677764.1 hypothetical protein NAEGRDRAFT_79544 [Naegleria gruberi strain NEG-M]
MAHDSNLIISEEDFSDEEINYQEEGFNCELCGQYVGNNFEYEHHLETLHKHVCTECSRVFPSAFLLSVHLEEKHDSFFSVMTLKKDCYQCLVEDKSICNAKFRTSEERDEHMRNVHLYKNDFSFENIGFIVNYEED